MLESCQSPSKHSKIFLDKNGNTNLHKAVKERNMSLLYQSSMNECIINQQNRDGYSALHYAVKHEDIDMIEAVLQCGVDPLLKTKLSQTASDIAHINKRPDIVELIDRYSPGLSQTIIDRDKSKTIDLLKKWINLHNVANSMKHSSVFQENLMSMRLDYYLNQNQFIHLVAADDYDAVYQLSNNTDQQISRYVNNTHSINGKTPLALAISNSNGKMINLLLKIGADPTIRLADGTPLTHYAWSMNTPFTILLNLLYGNQSVWHMRCPNTGLTILFTLALCDQITDVHINKILTITECLILRDRDSNNLDFCEFCKLQNRTDLIDIVWESIAKMMGSKLGKMKLIHLAIASVGETILAVPKIIFERLYMESELPAILMAYEQFMENVCSLQNQCKQLMNAVRQGDLSQVKQHNVADFIDKTGLTALHEAIICDQYEIAQWLLAERPSLLTISDTKDRYPFHYAYSVANIYGKKYVHLLADMRIAIDQKWLTDMNNCVPSSMNQILVDEIKKINYI